jgi:hypothetical protein
MDNRGHRRPPGRTGGGSLLPGGAAPTKGAPALGLAGRHELRGDPKRLVREAGGDSPSGAVPVDDAGTEHHLGGVPDG